MEKADKTEALYCGLKRNQKKVFKRNKKDYPRLADHIGFLPITMISPNDSVLITEGSEERRKFMDAVLSQTDTTYLDTLIAYTKTLANRNALLKHFADTRSFDPSLLEIYTEQLLEHGNRIYQSRKSFMEEFLPLFHEHYAFLSQDKESVTLAYTSPLNEGDFAGLLSACQDRDRQAERSTVGIHKDDLEFLLEGHPLKRTGSQGQQKSYLIALKMAQYSYIFRKKENKPLLLLDDIFDKLDETRIRQLLQLAIKDEIGQVFITDTHPDRVKSLFTSIGTGIRQYTIQKGAIQHV